MPTVRVMDLDRKTVAELQMTKGVERILPYVTPVFDDIAEFGSEYSAPPTTYDWDVNVVQGATDAWAMGYNGTGVKIAVIDTGADMAHPDLQGQQARYTSGPYAGWPIAYDDMTAFIWSMGYAGGWAADTSVTSPDMGGHVVVWGTEYSIANIRDADGNHVTSASGVYHLGNHTDSNLQARIGAPVAVLVVDSTTPGVYDTVYVDLLGDHDFGNDKPCTRGDEISYFDSYNAISLSTQYASWDGGDGYADVSGGMVYWISDGVNVLPGSSWTYGATFTPASGNAVAFYGEFSPGESHGTMTASAALAEGRTLGGQLGGMAPGARLIAISLGFNIVNSWQFAELGADGLMNTGDEANIVTNSYGYPDTAITAGYEYFDQIARGVSTTWPDTLWCWAAGNGGPGYGTTTSVVDPFSIRVGAGTTMQYRTWFGNESDYRYSKWGDVAPFSSSGPTRTGKLNAEIVASGMYSLEPAPLNMPDYNGGTGDGSVHYQIGSGTSHASPTVAGAAALGFQAYFERVGAWPNMALAKSRLMASAEDMHFDPLKQGAGWLNAARYVEAMGETTGIFSTVPGLWWMDQKDAIYPGALYLTPYETMPNFLLPGEQDTNATILTENYNSSVAASINISAMLLIKTQSNLIVNTTVSSEDQYFDITDEVSPGTDLLKVTIFMPLSVFDPNLDYVTDVQYALELDDWFDLNIDGVMNVSGARPELFRYSIDGGDCNYNQVMIKDPLERTHQGLIAVLKALKGASNANISIQIDCYELRPFPWVTFKDPAGTDWVPSVSKLISPGTNISLDVRVQVPLGTPVGTYAAAIYIDSGDRVQAMPVVINVPASTYEFTFGEPYPFDTPYSNNFTGLANKQWRFDTGEWRIYWALPTTGVTDPNAYLMTSVEWSELPTDINIHFLAASRRAWPYDHEWVMSELASSDERYLAGNMFSTSGGVFGVWTNTGGPKEVIAAPLGKWMTDTLLTPAPFAVLLRCPVMSGNTSHDFFTGSTRWITVNGYEPDSISLNISVPGPTPLNGTRDASYNITTVAPVEVRGGGSIQLTQDWSYIDPIFQDQLTGNFDWDLATAAYTRPVEVAGAKLLRVDIFELFGAPDLDLGLWRDVNRNGVADLSEPYWFSGELGSLEEIELNNPVSGTYLIKVLGFNVTGDPGYFYIEINQAVYGFVEATGFESPASSGLHNFTVAYDLAPSPGTYTGAASFGFMGATDMFSIPVEITIVDKPAIERLTPADGSIVGSSSLVISFHFNDSAGANVGLNPSTVRVFLDGALNTNAWVNFDGNDVHLPYAYGLAQGTHFVTVMASDLDGNAADPVTNTFTVNSIIDQFTFSMMNPLTGIAIANGATVPLKNVTVSGTSDPDANVTVATQSGDYEAVANATGVFELRDVLLIEGLNVLTITTTNNANVSASGLMIVTADTICNLRVDPLTSPTNSIDAIFNGTAEPGAVLLVDGLQVNVSSDGSWQVGVNLVEGLNSIHFNATDHSGNRASFTAFVLLDTTPPEMTVSAPTDGTVVSQPVVTLHGTIEPDATISIQGAFVIELETSLSNWTARVSLVNGTNVITVVAMDAVGNSAQRTVTLVYTPPPVITPDDMRKALDDLNDSLRREINDSQDFASLVMFIALILFMIAVLFTGALWYVLGKRVKGFAESESEHSLEEIEDESPKDVEQEFEDLEKEIRRDGNP